MVDRTMYTPAPLTAQEGQEGPAPTPTPTGTQDRTLDDALGQMWVGVARAGAALAQVLAEFVARLKALDHALVLAPTRPPDRAPWTPPNARRSKARMYRVRP